MIKSNTVVSIKLVTSEELVARYVSQDQTSVTINRPLSFMMTQKGVGLVPFLFSCQRNTDVTVERSAIVAVVPSDENIAKEYLSQTSGIKLV